MRLESRVLDNGITRISLFGRLDIAGSGAIETQFTIHSASKKALVLIDLSGVEFISSIGMRLLVAATKAQTGRGGKIVMANAQPLVAEALTTANIVELVPLYSDFDAACADLLAAAGE
jgi:anti-sigma B factor antagonist